MKKVLLFISIIFIVFISIFFLSKNVILKDDNKVTNKEKTTTKTSNKTEALKTNKDKEAKLTIVGDLLFEQPLYDDNKNMEDTTYFDLVKPYFEKDDLTIANLEVPISDGKLKVSGVGYSFCAPQSVGKLLTTLDIEVFSTANNHSYDRGNEGIASTIDFFKDYKDITTVGTRKNKDDEIIKYREINGIKFSFVSYTYGTNSKPNPSDRYKVNYFRNIDLRKIDDDTKNRIKEDVSTARNNSDVVIVMMHWGKEFTNDENEEQQTLANYLNSLGVDIIIGNHSHSIQPIKYVGDKHKTLVYYSLGNFVSADYIVDRVGEKFRNAYQFGLLSTLNIKLDSNNKVTISNVKAEPIINYYDTNLKNFKLVPARLYTNELEKNHYLYKKNFTKDFISNMYNNVINEQFRA